MVGFSMMVWAECHDVVHAVRAPIGYRNNMMSLEEHSATAHFESWLLAPFADPAGAPQHSPSNSRTTSDDIDQDFSPCWLMNWIIND